MRMDEKATTNVRERGQKESPKFTRRTIVWNTDTWTAHGIVSKQDLDQQNRTDDRVDRAAAESNASHDQRN
jgi:hypothetical protein